jgi:TatD DNase family protein
MVFAAAGLALKTDMPVIIHSRDAAEDTYLCLREFCRKRKDAGLSGSPGVIHCYSYSPEQAREYVKMGFYIGIGGALTFKNSKKLRTVAQETPLANIVLETDCPYMAPVPHRGERNSSLFLPLVVQAVAELKGMAPEEVIARTCENAKRLYRLP